MPFIIRQFYEKLVKLPACLAQVQGQAKALVEPGVVRDTDRITRRID